MKPTFSFFLLFLIRSLFLNAQPTPARSQEEVAEWQQMKYGMFIHFNMNTYAGVEYDRGRVPASAFKPDKLDVDQWIRTARDAGMKYAVLTAKHCGGFCLWDSKVTFLGKEYDYDIASSGYADLVAQFMASCKKNGVRPALYYCLWDTHNQPVCSKGEYFNLTKGHITELVSKYPGLVEIWIDIPSVLKPAERAELYAIVKHYQPKCMVTCNNGFTDGSVLANFPADITNGERTLPPASGHNPWREVNGNKYYIPMEVCQTMNQNWFWMPDDVTKSVRTLYHWYANSVNRGANLLLDVPPDLSGRIPAELVGRLMELKTVIDNPALLPPLVSFTAYRPVTATGSYDGGRPEYAPFYAADEDPNTRWLAAEGDTLPTLTVDLGDEKQFNTVIIMEPYEPHILEFIVEYQVGGKWKTLLEDHFAGALYEHRFDPVRSRWIRLRVTRFSTGPNPCNVLTGPDDPTPEEGATIAEFQVLNQH